MADELQEGLARQSLRVWDETGVALRQALSQRVTVAMLGPASSGKDAGIRALFGVDFGEVSPIPGSTDRVRAAALDADGRVLLVNTPGLGDIRAAVEARTLEAIADLDIVLFVVNAEGGATIDERQDIEALRARGRPVLVCLNKIDLIRPTQRDAFVSETTRQLGVSPADVAVCAFDPLPQLADGPIGLERIVAWIHDRLADSGKELLIAKHMRNRALACEPIVRAAARRASLAGAVPVPGADAPW